MSEALSAEETLRARAADLPECLRAVAMEISPAARTNESFVVTGVGASEGPARATAALMRKTWGVRADVVPLSVFATGEPRGDVLVVFSQALSPNARLAIDGARAFERAILFTSAREETADARAALRAFRERGRIVALPQRDGLAADAIAREHGTLVRVLGPCAATLAGALHVGAAATPELYAAIESAPARAREAIRHVDDARLEDRVVFVTAGDYGELCAGIPTLWSEALYAPRPHLLDVLQFAHGPFQSFYDSRVTLILLERPGKEKDLFDRLARMIAPERHTVVRLSSTLPAPLAPLDHFAQVLEIVCCALRARPRDLRVWPGCGRDAPLYELGRR